MDLEKVDEKNKAEVALDKMKDVEKNTSFHSKKIGNKTFVFCKNKERIEEFEKSMKLSKITL